MKLKLAIIIGRIVNILSKALGKSGSVIGGYYALKIDKKLFKHVKYPKYIIGVTGSTGKTSLVELAADLMIDNNLKIAYNKAGSNIKNGIASLIIDNTKLNGVMDKDVLLMEIDEKNVKHITKYIKLTHLVLTNIARDQLVRGAHPEATLEEIGLNLSKETTLIINADDPLLMRYTLDNDVKAYYYGIEKTKYSTDKPILNNLDGTYCPICGNKLIYDFYHYNHIGSYKCSKCSFKRPKLDFIGTDINLEKYKMKLDKKEIKLPSNFFFSAYFTLGAYAVCNIVGIKKEDIIKKINDYNKTSRRDLSLPFKKYKARILLSKNETNVSYASSIRYALNETGDKTVVLGFDNVSRRYTENDISWLYDIEFELLKDKSIKEIIVFGRFRYDIVTRLNYAGIKDNITILEDKESVLPTLNKNTNNNVYFMVYFDMAAYFEKQLKEAKYEN